MSEHTSNPASVEINGNGGDSGSLMDAAMSQRLRAVTREFTHRELGELTGMSHETVRRYMEGKVPGPGFIKRLCESLGISADWLLLGRGLPVYQREPIVNEISGSIDELFDGLSQYLKRLHVELLRAEARIQRAREMPRPSAAEAEEAGDPAALTAQQSDPAEVSPAEFVDPFAEATIAASGSPPPAAARAPTAPSQTQIRFVLGPFNGRQLVSDEPLGAEIRVRLNAENQVELVIGKEPGLEGTLVYRRVFDRVFRWTGTRGT